MTTTLAPMAWTTFETSPPTFSKAQWIAIINRAVNNGIDARQGTPPALDTYNVWPASGWCHDYAITKRFELLLRGFAASELLLCECKTADGTEHMVLIAGGRVMDNLNQQVRPSAQLGYTIVRQQSSEDPDIWEAPDTLQA